MFASSWKHQQELSWVPIDRDVKNRVGQAAMVQLPGEREPGRDLELLPSVTLAWSETADDGRPPCAFGAEPGSFNVCGAAVDYGMGLKWALSPGVTLDLVVNPDFSQIEADPAKLSVNNRFAIYLHDTPAKAKFRFPRRAFSHGCMRVHKPLELAKLLLERDGAWPLVERYKVLKHRDRTQFNLKRPVSLVVEYITARVDEGGRVHWLMDVYGRDKLQIAGK